MIAGALLAASLLLADPSGDAHGAGDLIPPTAAVYSSSAPFDLVDVEVLEGSTLTLRVRLADRPDPGGLPNGITLPVIDLYVDTAEGGREELLPGPGLRMPPEQGWEVAVRVTGDRAFARRAGDEGAVDHPVTVTTQDDTLTIATPFAAPEHAPGVHAMTGVYDAFDRDAWRPLARSPSPWAFSSETARYPVVDLLADDDAAQRAALESGVLPQGRQVDPAAPWLVLMVLGLVIAAAGLVLRSRVGRRAPASVLSAGDRADDAAATDDEPDESDAERFDGAVATEAMVSETVEDESLEDDPMLTFVDASRPGEGRSHVGAWPRPDDPPDDPPDEPAARDDARAAEEPAEAPAPDPAARPADALPWPNGRGWGLGSAEDADQEAWTRGGESWARSLRPDPEDSTAEVPYDRPSHGGRGEADLRETDLYDAFEPDPGRDPTPAAAPREDGHGDDEADEGPRRDVRRRVGRDWR